MKYATVTTNLLDLWAEPRNNSERKSQLLYGDTVGLGISKNGFRKVTESDGYSGWADERFLLPSNAPKRSNLRGWRQAVVCDPSLPMHSKDTGASVPPHFLYYGTRLLVRRGDRVKYETRLVDNKIAQVSSRGIQFYGRVAHKTERVLVVKEAKKFLGVPYLWGGTTPAGFDCSGLVRAVFGQFGIYLPRDTKDQIRVGDKVGREDVRSGDLLFFDRHIALAIDRTTIIHASRSAGGVRIQSLKRGDTDYRADLDRDFKIARRLIVTD